MTEAVTAEKEPKKFVYDYQITDDNGNPIGPPQHFEADTNRELVDKIAAAHKNSAKKMYETIKKVKIGELITPDPETPIREFKRKSLTADERVRLSSAIKDPQTSPDAIKTLLEAELGESVDAIREALQYVEIRKRIEVAEYETQKFLEVHPEYVVCPENRDIMQKWLNKRNLAITKKNLELAYEDLNNEQLLVTQVRAPELIPPTTTVEVPAPVVTPVVEATPLQPEPIVPAVTPAPPISETPAEVRPKSSSSGLVRSDGSAVPTPETPKAPGITAQQIARMNSREFEIWIRDPSNKKMVDEMKR